VLFVVAHGIPHLPMAPLRRTGAVLPALVGGLLGHDAANSDTNRSTGSLTAYCAPLEPLGAPYRKRGWYCRNCRVEGNPGAFRTTEHSRTWAVPLAAPAPPAAAAAAATVAASWAAQASAAACTTIERHTDSRRCSASAVTLQKDQSHGGHDMLLDCFRWES